MRTEEEIRARFGKYIGMGLSRESLIENELLIMKCEELKWVLDD